MSDPLLDAFDPTPEEVEKEERRAPRKLPKCIKCKDLPRLPLSNQQREEMNAAFTSISDVLCSPCAAFLTRDDVAQLRLAHMHLCRAGKERYCERCASATIAYARYLISA